MTTTAEKIVPAEEKPVADKRRALGRGLDSLLPGGPRIVTGPAAIPATPPAPSAGSAASATHSEGVVLLNLDQDCRDPLPDTPQLFSEASLAELAESIKSQWRKCSRWWCGRGPMAVTFLSSVSGDAELHV